MSEKEERIAARFIDEDSLKNMTEEGNIFILSLIIQSRIFLLLFAFY